MSIRITRNFTVIPNEILGLSELKIEERYLYCVLLRHCGQKETCFPSQSTLGKELGFTGRYIRVLLKRLMGSGLITWRRDGWNRSNTYTVAKELRVDRNGDSYHIGNKFPFHQGNEVPDKSTYLTGKGKKSYAGFEKFKESLVRMGILHQQ